MPFLARNIGHRRHGPKEPRIQNQPVEAAKPLFKGGRQPHEAFFLSEIRRNEHGPSALGLDRIVERFKVALRTRETDDGRASPRRFEGGRPANPAARASDKDGFV
jgi:hypothetical protein